MNLWATGKHRTVKVANYGQLAGSERRVLDGR
jgi:hypothetical protein